MEGWSIGPPPRADPNPKQDAGQHRLLEVLDPDLDMERMFVYYS